MKCVCGRALPTPQPGLFGRVASCKQCGTRYELGWKVSGDEDKLDAARRHVLEMIDEGVRCPCCGKNNKARKRNLNSDMAGFLINLAAASVRRKKCNSRGHCTNEKHKHEGDIEWVHVRDFNGGAAKASSDGSYLTMWGLIERKPRRPKEPCSGLYRITKAGMDFAFGHTKVKAWAMVNNAAVVYWADELVGVLEALGDEFDYEDVMGHTRICDDCGATGTRTCPRCEKDLRVQDAEKASKQKVVTT